MTSRPEVIPIIGQATAAPVAQRVAFTILTDVSTNVEQSRSGAFDCSSCSWPPLCWRVPSGCGRAAVQPRHTKLGLAAREGNWFYASCELHELKEAFDTAAKTWPKSRTFEIPAMMDSVITGPMAALDRAIKANDSARFTAAYEQLTVACNTCHRSVDRGVIVIQSPAGSPFADQDFRPVKE